MQKSIEDTLYYDKKKNTSDTIIGMVFESILRCERTHVMRQVCRPLLGKFTSTKPLLSATNILTVKRYIIRLSLILIIVVK